MGRANPKRETARRPADRPMQTSRKVSALGTGRAAANGASSSSSALKRSGCKNGHRAIGSGPSTVPVPAGTVNTFLSRLWPRSPWHLAALWSRRAFLAVLRPVRDIAYYRYLMDVATNYEQWAAAALMLDRLLGYDKWKLDPLSPEYDYKLVSARLDALKAAREGSELAPVIFLLRTSLFRNLGDMGKPTLFATANIGTKKLIEDYVDEVVKHILFICETDSPHFSIQQKLEFFINTRQSFGRTALLLSGGATLGLHHIGVVKCLYECKLLPRIISGTSSGSIIAAILCCTTDDDLKGLMRPESINLNFFHEVGDPDNLFVKLNRLLTSGVLFDVEVLKECVRSNIGDVTFQEAYNRTRRILNISVSSSGIFEMPRLLNYVTAPNVVIWSAVAASCAVPFVYSSAPLVAKEKGAMVPWNPSGHRWIDGSVESDLPMVRLAEIFNVNHTIVSQVNPHILPFLHSGIVPSRGRIVVGKCLDLARRVVQHYVNYGIEYDICPNVSHRINQMLSQKYYGDITIVPKVGIKEYLNIIRNPTHDSFLEACLKGERATWPKVSLIRNHLRIELAIDEAVYRLTTQLLDQKAMRKAVSLDGNRKTQLVAPADDADESSVPSGSLSANSSSSDGPECGVPVAAARRVSCPEKFEAYSKPKLVRSAPAALCRGRKSEPTMSPLVEPPPDTLPKGTVEAFDKMLKSG